MQPKPVVRLPAWRGATWTARRSRRLGRWHQGEPPSACTHADADHVEGLIGLLKSSLVPVREVWLPGLWSSRLADLCREQAAFLRELHRDVHDAEEVDPETLDSALEHEGRLEPDRLSASAHPPDWLRQRLARIRRDPVTLHNATCSHQLV